MIAPLSPKFFVVYAFCPVAEDFIVVAIVSNEVDADRYVDEIKAESLPASKMTMTMEQVKTALVKDRLAGIAAAIDKLLAGAVK